MKNNLGIKVLSAIVVGVVFLIVWIQRSSHTDKPTQEQNTNNFNAAMARQFNDNIRDVSARLLETQKKLETVEKNYKSHQTPIPKVSIPAEITEAIEQLKQDFNAIKETHPEPDYPIDGEKPSAHRHILDIDALLMKKNTSPQEKNYWDKLKQSHAVTKKNIIHQTSTDEPKSIPYYTIPAGADLSKTTLLSALIGEVPNEGKLMQPLFPFTALVSRGDLMASNGVALPPDISGMKVNGYAIGVGSFLDNISCVRAYVTSILFTFQDGHYVTLGNEEMKDTTDLVNNESLGYLTTAYGNPCIHGQYHTNAPRVLTAMFAAGGVQSMGNTLSQWQMSANTEGNSVIRSPTGSFGKFALGNLGAEGSIKVADWLEKRIQGSFDMVFVPASLATCYRKTCHYSPNHLSLHITKTINLDKEPNGRVLDYGHLQSRIFDTSLR